jgi:hypothetical protein
MRLEHSLVCTLQMATAPQWSVVSEHKDRINDPMTVLHSMYAGRCAWCNATSAARKCGRCKSAGYCNRVCQKAHWHTHQQTCGFLRVVRRRGECETGGVLINTRLGKTRTKTLRVQIGVSVHPDENNTVPLLRCGGSTLPGCKPTRPIAKGEAMILLGYHCTEMGQHYRMVFACMCECGHSQCRNELPTNTAWMRSLHFYRLMESDTATCIANIPRPWSVHREDCSCNLYETGHTDLRMQGPRGNRTPHHLEPQ